jgi:hypothetical protein
MHWLGAPGLPLYHTVILGLLALFTLLRIHQVREQARRPAQHVTLVNTTPTVLEMMPEAQDVEQETGGADLQDLDVEAQPPAAPGPSPDEKPA